MKYYPNQYSQQYWNLPDKCKQRYKIYKQVCIYEINLLHNKNMYKNMFDEYFDDIERWCYEHCVGYWYINEFLKPKFQLKEDAAICKLAWY